MSIVFCRPRCIPFYLLPLCLLLLALPAQAAIQGEYFTWVAGSSSPPGRPPRPL